MPAPDLYRSLGSARCVLTRPQAPPLPVQVTQFWSALCLSPKTRACNHPQPSHRAQTAVQVHWSTASPTCVSYRYLPSSWRPHAVQLEMRLLLITISALGDIVAVSILPVADIPLHQSPPASESSACYSAAPVAPTCTMNAKMQSCDICDKAITAAAASSIPGLCAIIIADDPNSGEEPHF